MKILLIACLFAALAVALPEGAERVRQFLDAIRKGDSGAIRTLLEAEPALVDARWSDGVPAVRLALYYRHPEIASMLIERGAALDVCDAASAGQLKRLRELVERDPSLVNRYSSDGATPLGLAAFFGHRDAVEFLLDRGAKIDMPATNPAFPFVPLHSAMAAGHKAIVELLLARGADVKVREGGGMTVLHVAAALGNLEHVEMLLKRGADPGAKMDDGKLPEDFARERKFEAVADALVKARGR